MTTKKSKAPKIVERDWNRELEAQREKFIPDPPAHRIHKVGDMVIYGAHPNAQVLEVFDGGKYLKVKLWGMYPHYHDKIYEERETMLNWLDVLPSKNKDLPSLIENEDIRLNYSNKDISSVIHDFYNGGIDMNPEYQREHVWNHEDKVSLIDSIFNNRSIGSYILIWMPYGHKHHYEVCDGKQRINALCEFYEDRFQYKGKYFSELSFKDQNHFECFVFPRAEIKEASEQEVPREKKIKIFIHVNSCGHVMDEAHLNKVREMLK